MLDLRLAIAVEQSFDGEASHAEGLFRDLEVTQGGEDESNQLRLPVGVGLGENYLEPRARGLLGDPKLFRGDRQR